jgi:hypothetical protein
MADQQICHYIQNTVKPKIAFCSVQNIKDIISNKDVYFPLASQTLFLLFVFTFFLPYQFHLPGF